MSRRIVLTESKLKRLIRQVIRESRHPKAECRVLVEDGMLLFEINGDSDYNMTDLLDRAQDELGVSRQEAIDCFKRVIRFSQPVDYNKDDFKLSIDFYVDNELKTVEEEDYNKDELCFDWLDNANLETTNVGGLVQAVAELYPEFRSKSIYKNISM